MYLHRFLLSSKWRSFFYWRRNIDPRNYYSKRQDGNIWEGCSYRDFSCRPKWRNVFIKDARWNLSKGCSYRDFSCPRNDGMFLLRRLVYIFPEGVPTEISPVVEMTGVVIHTLSMHYPYTIHTLSMLYPCSILLNFYGIPTNFWPD